MKAKLVGLAFATALSLSASAETYHFAPITSPTNTDLQSLGNQLAMDVDAGGAGDVLFTFTNNGSVESSLTRVYFDDAPSALFSNLAVAAQSPGVNFALNAVPHNLTRGEEPLFSFFANHSAAAQSPRYNNGVNHGAEVPGEFLTLSALLNPGKTFANVIDSLDAGGLTNRNFLRVGLRVIGIDRFNDSASASFLDTSGAASPSPIPESSTYGMLLAGLGLITAIARRRQAN